MKQCIRAAIERIRSEAVAHSRLLAILIIALCLLPATARAAGLSDILSLFETITSTLQNAIGGALTWNSNPQFHRSTISGSR